MACLVLDLHIKEQNKNNESRPNMTFHNCRVFSCECLRETSIPPMMATAVATIMTGAMQSAITRSNQLKGRRLAALIEPSHLIGEQKQIERIGGVLPLLKTRAAFSIGPSTGASRTR